VVVPLFRECPATSLFRWEMTSILGRVPSRPFVVFLIPNSPREELMRFIRTLARIGLVPVFGMLLLSGGCGGGGESPGSAGDPAIGVQRKSAREAAYGPAGIPKGTGTATNSQAAARQKAQSGR